MSYLDLLATLNPWWQHSSERRERQRPKRRALFPQLFAAVAEPSPDRRAAVLVGPRQSGKSTLLGQVADLLLDEGWPAGNVLYYDFFDQRGSPAPTLDAVSEHRPTSLKSGAPCVLLFDEVTRASGWAASLKRLVDDARREPAASFARFIVSDSAASVVHSGLTEALQGRTTEHRLSGLSLSEFLSLLAREHESPEQVLQRIPGAFDRFVSLGGFPGLHLFDDYGEARRLIRDDIADLALSRDLDREGVDVPRVRDLFAYLVRDSGALFNAAERSRDLLSGEKSVDVRTVRKWVDLLEHCCLIARLEAWSPLDRRTKADRQLSARPKIYAEDHGFVAAFDPRPDPLSREQVRDRVLETLVFAHLREYVRGKPELRLSYFRDTGGELDFVIDSSDHSVAIEVTSTPKASKHLGKTMATCKRAGIGRLVLACDAGVPRTGAEYMMVDFPHFLLNMDAVLEVR